MSEATWTITPHVCSGCFGRILQSGATFRCSGCEAEAADSPAEICGCGISLGPLALRAGLAGSRFRCGRNPRRGPDSPAQFVVLFGDPDAAEAGGQA